MASIPLPTEDQYETSLRQGQVRHAVKTALACGLAAGLAFVFRLPSGQLVPVFAYLLMTAGMLSPRLNWLLALFGITVSAIGSALILLIFRDALFLYLALTLLWIFTVLLFSNWSSLPATMAAMVSALGIFVFFQGTAGDALRFYIAYELNWLIGGFSVVVIQTLIWPSTTQKVFVERRHNIILRRLVQDLQTATASHEALFARFRKGLTGKLAALGPVAGSTRLIDVNSLRCSTKLVVMIILLLLEEGLLGFPGGSQVAFYATFFASTGNLGRQNKTDLVGLAGLLGGFLYGVVAAFLTSRMPHLPLLLALVFFGQFLANLTFQRLPRYSAAGLQAGLAIPFAYLATSGPEWGSFTTVQTRFWGLVVAGFTAVVVHAYLWPVLPMRQLRASIAIALRATAESLTGLFGRARLAWEGAPPSLGNAVARSHDLLDDARYLPGPEHTDPAYHGILACLQEIEANLEYIHFLVCLEDEYPLRRQLFRVVGDYAELARTNLEQVARQFQRSPSRAARVESVRWDPDASGRWERVSNDDSPVPDRLAAIARCLDQIARAVERISGIAREINVRHSGR